MRPGRDTFWRVTAAACAALWLCAGVSAEIAGAAETAGPPSAHEVASGLARLGPRPDPENNQDKAVAFLLDALRRAGLQGVRSVPVRDKPGIVNVEGVLPGSIGREIILSGHYDTVKKSPGAGDDASGCGVAIATAAELARAPLRHTVRVILFDGEETGLYGSRGWVDMLAPAARDRILANVNLEMVGWPGSTGPTIHAIPVRSMEEHGTRTTTPGWLVRAALDSSETAQWPLHMSDPRFSLPMQLLLRGTVVSFGADSGSFLERGIPAVTLSDSSFFAMDPAWHRSVDTVDRLDAGRLQAWTRATVALVRELDRLDSRPASDDTFLVLADQVLPWWGLAAFGLVLAALLVAHHRRHHHHRRHWAFPGLLAASALAAPALAIPLLTPAAILALVPPATRWRRFLWSLLGLLPLFLYVLLLAGAWALKLSAWKAGYRESWLGAALVVAAFVVWVLALRPPKPPAPAVADAPPALPAS
jgi:hypothetical protein